MSVKHRIFVSSSIGSLFDERREVVAALLTAGCIPQLSERDPTARVRAFDQSQKLIRQSDYYLLIVGDGQQQDEEKEIIEAESELVFAEALEVSVIGLVQSGPAAIGSLRSLQRLRDKLKSLEAMEWNDVSDIGFQSRQQYAALSVGSPRPGLIDSRLSFDGTRLDKLEVLVIKISTRLDSLVIHQADSLRNALAGGDEEIEIRYNDYDQWNTVRVTWNVVAGTLCPLMMDEASEETLIEAIEGKISSITGCSELEVNPEDFQTLKVQLLAMDLIELSMRRRQIRDSNTYWKLTPHGRATTIALRRVGTKRQPRR